jgi:hypothetical protein
LVCRVKEEDERVEAAERAKAAKATELAGLPAEEKQRLWLAEERKQARRQEESAHKHLQQQQSAELKRAEIGTDTFPATITAATAAHTLTALCVLFTVRVDSEKNFAKLSAVMDAKMSAQRLKKSFRQRKAVESAEGALIEREKAEARRNKHELRQESRKIVHGILESASPHRSPSSSSRSVSKAASTRGSPSSSTRSVSKAASTRGSPLSSQKSTSTATATAEAREDPGWEKGDVVVYTGSESGREKVEIVQVHREDVELYYTIHLPRTDSERQTTLDKLSSVEASRTSGGVAASRVRKGGNAQTHKSAEKLSTRKSLARKPKEAIKASRVKEPKKGVVRGGMALNQKRVAAEADQERELKEHMLQLEEEFRKEEEEEQVKNQAEEEQARAEGGQARAEANKERTGKQAEPEKLGAAIEDRLMKKGLKKKAAGSGADSAADDGAVGTHGAGTGADGAAATKIQSQARMNSARQFVVQTFKKDGLLVAMPGTIQNQSGWYEMPPTALVKTTTAKGAGGGGAPQAETQVVRFEISAVSGWAFAEGPIGKSEWLRKDLAKKRQLEDKMLDLALVFTEDHDCTLTKLQAAIRSHLSKQRLVRRVEAFGLALPLPGTRRGKDGHYCRWEEGRGVVIATVAVAHAESNKKVANKPAIEQPEPEPVFHSEAGTGGRSTEERSSEERWGVSLIDQSKLYSLLSSSSSTTTTKVSPAELLYGRVVEGPWTLRQWRVGGEAKKAVERRRVGAMRKVALSQAPKAAWKTLRTVLTMMKNDSQRGLDRSMGAGASAARASGGSAAADTGGGSPGGAAQGLPRQKSVQTLHVEKTMREKLSMLRHAGSLCSVGGGAGVGAAAIMAEKSWQDGGGNSGSGDSGGGGLPVIAPLADDAIMKRRRTTIIKTEELQARDKQIDDLLDTLDVMDPLGEPADGDDELFNGSFGLDDGDLGDLGSLDDIDFQLQLLHSSAQLHRAVANK